MNLIILGPQGSGKGTQAKLLAQKFNLFHLESGQLLRDEAQLDTPKGQLVADLLKSGKLLPFETVLEVLEPQLLKATNGFILDGTPRDVKQAEYLDWYLNIRHLIIDKVILLNIPRPVSLERLSKRAIIEQRSDDTPAAIEERLKLYEERTLPVIAYYRKQGKLIEVDGTPDINTIFKDILARLTIA